ncbi:MAG: 1-acyl-sn-glycerol-3-phosphate acyltransferase [Clostridium sp.]|nr:1-acyl-sn-glycerol-3-phosphate acyltransferase [Clostridium sp.]
MFKSIINGMRFIFSALKISFKLPKVNKTLESEGKDAAYDEAMLITKKHIDEAIKIGKINLDITGTENIPDEPVVFMGNHQSYVDIYMLLKAIDRRVILIAKKEINKIPVISKLASYLQVLFLDRDNPRKDLIVIRKAINILKDKNYDVLVYPEGTRSKSKKMGKFLGGSFRIAQKTKAPIVPVVIDNAYKVLEKDKRIKENVNVHLKILEPIYIEKLSQEEQKNISSILKGKIQKELDDLNKTTN